MLKKGTVHPNIGGLGGRTPDTRPVINCAGSLICSHDAGAAVMEKVQKYRTMAREAEAKARACFDTAQRSQWIELGANWQFLAAERLKLLESRLIKRGFDEPPDDAA
jgi:hypothetical protein